MPDDHGNIQLISAIKNEIASRGPITFARFMELALYHPEFGYYNSKTDIFGRGGDYYTSVDLHPVFGRLVARQLEQMWRLLGGPSPFTVVEMGAGRGFMCCDVLSFLKEQAPDCFGSIHYVIDERSPAMRGVQKEKLDSLAFSEKVEWKELDAIEPCGVTGAFVSNELVDAFPVHKVKMTVSGLKENYVTLGNDMFAFETGPVSSEQLNIYLNKYGVTLETGQSAEINLAAGEWLKKIAERLRRGFVLTIDYGHPAEKLYSAARARGTLMCYYKHTLSEDPLARAGRQDITAHVNFTDLAVTGAAHGLETAGLTKQSFFLMSLAAEEFSPTPTFASSTSLLKRNLAFKKLIEPEGLGGFPVLLQYKGLDSKPDLLGLMFMP
jgi:SAM-dependent MidA family methyltransferase